MSQHPQKFDGRLVRVRALLSLSWEGDNFLSEPNPRRIPSHDPAYVWCYWKAPYDRQVYKPIGTVGRGSVYGWFTGYFHFVPTHKANGVFDAGPLQFETIEVSIPNPQPRSLAQAIRDNGLEEVRSILHSGAKLNVWDEHRSPPLIEAAASRHPEIADELLAAGADPNFAGQGGSTALMAAAWDGDLRIARALVDRGASANAADVNGETALIFASQTCKDGKMVQLLLNAGADPNAKTTNGTTSLMAAAGNPIDAEELLKAGANPAVKDASGHTVEDDACDRGEKGHYEVCQLVREALAKAVSKK